MTDLAWICMFAPLVAAVWIGVSPRFRAGAGAPEEPAGRTCGLVLACANPRIAKRPTD